MKQKWLKLAQTAGDFQIALVFKAFYFFIITPIGFIYSRFSDPFNIKSFPEWSEIPTEDKTINKLREQ